MDAEWFAHARDGEVLGLPVKLCPPEEELIRSKAFVQERERFYVPMSCTSFISSAKGSSGGG